MSEHQLHLEQDFFDNPNQQEFSYLPPTHDDPHPQNKSYPPHSAPPHATPQDLEPTAGSNRFYQEYRRIFSVAYNIQAEKERLADVLRDLNERIRAMENKLQGNESRGR
jgi:hypothetical protein